MHPEWARDIKEVTVLESDPVERAVGNFRRALEWLQLFVPLPAFAVLIASIWLFAQVKPMVDSDPGGGLLVFWTFTWMANRLGSVDGEALCVTVRPPGPRTRTTSC